ncbi:exodeoxyribonuclease VII large subunit [Fodinicurvata sp. EGI_FJ10296]|uniref:exodeoxyribonuclease VII large subunit n=1 Tax=Fodinicurvata sp. EGI_FJ10296 TaxID=3231908 RepID=UPI0034523535
MTQDLPFTGSASAPAGRPASNVAEYSVSEISAALKQTVEAGFGHIRVRGEISRPKIPGSGHLYMTLKDDRAVLDAVCWRTTLARLSIRPEEGMEVVCTGRLTTYAGQSKYQIVIESMELAGEGALLKLLEDRKRRLAAEGLFDAARKRPLPFLPTVIGVVTSPTGAVIRDILHRLAERFPRHVLIWPVPVQGEGAAARIAAAIEGFNRLDADAGSGTRRHVPRPDLLIVARGGGSLEDLMAFNEESVVRAAAASIIPVISAVGHETDTTLIDLAADRRAPTPSAAAEMAVPVRSELLADVLDRAGRLEGATARLLDDRRFRIESAGKALGDPARLWEAMAQRLDDRAERLDRALPVLIDRYRARVAQSVAAIPHPRQSLREAARRVRETGARQDAARAVLLRRLQGDLGRVGARLVTAPLVRSMQDRRQRLADLDGRLTRAGQGTFATTAQRLEAQGKLLESYSYKKTLDRGFAVVRGPDGVAVTDPAALTAGDRIRLEFSEGQYRDAEILPTASGGSESAIEADERQGQNQGQNPGQHQAPRKTAAAVRKSSAGNGETGQGRLF